MSPCPVIKPTGASCELLSISQKPTNFYLMYLLRTLQYIINITSIWHPFLFYLKWKVPSWGKHCLLKKAIFLVQPFEPIANMLKTCSLLNQLYAIFKEPFEKAKFLVWLFDPFEEVLEEA